MALFVLGAGATRGCSFVDEKVNPCVPPLDADFFTQLQRVRNTKHQKLIDNVMSDVVDLFGSNSSVTLETIFTTLEQRGLTNKTRVLSLGNMEEFLALGADVWRK